MTDINWENVWKSSLKNNELFPAKLLNNKTLSVSCPTRFSNIGEFTVDITPTFNDDSINLEILTFNDNLALSDLEKVPSSINDFNSLADLVSKWELSNRLLDRFEIKSDGFETEKEAIGTLVDYINNKATESGRMFDDKLDELNDTVENNKSESYNKVINSIRESRRLIFKKVECILKNNYKWRSAKNEEFNDSVASFYDKNGNLAAVVSLVDDQLVIDLSKDITSKINVIQSDEEIEAEIVDDIDKANVILADKEIEQLEKMLADEDDNVNNLSSKKRDDYDVDETDCVFNDGKAPDKTFSESYLDKLAKRMTKLESMYLSYKIHNRK